MLPACVEPSLQRGQPHSLLLGCRKCRCSFVPSVCTRLLARACCVECVCAWSCFLAPVALSACALSCSLAPPALVTRPDAVLVLGVGVQCSPTHHGSAHAAYISVYIHSSPAVPLSRTTTTPTTELGRRRRQPCRSTQPRECYMSPCPSSNTCLGMAWHGASAIAGRACMSFSSHCLWDGLQQSAASARRLQVDSMSEAEDNTCTRVGVRLS